LLWHFRVSPLFLNKRFWPPFLVKCLDTLQKQCFPLVQPLPSNLLTRFDRICLTNSGNSRCLQARVDDCYRVEGVSLSMSFEPAFCGDRIVSPVPWCVLWFFTIFRANYFLCILPPNVNIIFELSPLPWSDPFPSLFCF